MAFPLALAWVLWPPVTVQWHKRVVWTRSGEAVDAVQTGFPLPDRMDVSEWVSSQASAYFLGPLLLNLLFWAATFAGVLWLLRVRQVARWVPRAAWALVALSLARLWAELMLDDRWIPPPAVIQDLGHRICGWCG